MERTTLLGESEPLGFEEALGIIDFGQRCGGIYKPRGLGQSMNEWLALWGVRCDDWSSLLGFEQSEIGCPSKGLTYLVKWKILNCSSRLSNVKYAGV